MYKQKRIAQAFCLALLVAVFGAQLSAQAASVRRAQQEQTAQSEEAEIQAALSYVPAERIDKLKAFINAHPNSSLRLRAEELIVSTRAEWGDEKLRAGDAKGGLEQFKLAVTDAPANMTDKLYVNVISKIPFNLFLLNQRAGATEVARLIEEKVKGDVKRLLALANFYLRVEDAEGATRVSELAVKLAPDMAVAHQSLAIARHIALDLDVAATEYARALELDPKMDSARRSLADLRRATGRAGDAMPLYREQLAADPSDRLARAGLVLSLLELGKKEDAERELEAALRDEPRNLQLLVGAAYWYASHGEGARSLELAQRAVEVEPRYVWAQIALARALISERRPLEAEQALRVARRFGRFPTLDYELANALAAAGLYQEAAAELQRSFAIRNGQIETQLAGRTRATAENFIELLARERRASIFQAKAADTEQNARLLKALLAFNLAMGEAGKRESVRESEAERAAREFSAGDDVMRVYRQLYAAERLLRAGVAAATALELAEGAASGAEVATDAPAANVAVMADELYSARLQAITASTLPPVPENERSVRASILRGRIEDAAGWALLNQEKRQDAIARLRRAASLLPENSIWSRAALWRLGAALEAQGEDQEALASYLKSYDTNAPDPVRRAAIEALYRKLNGSLEGLEAKLGAPSQPSSQPSPVAQSTTPRADAGSSAAAPQTTDAQPSANNARDVKTNEAPTQSSSATQAQDAGATQAQNRSPEAAASPVPDTSSQTVAPSPTPEQTTTQPASNATEAKTAAAPDPTPEPTPTVQETARQGGKGGGTDCALSIDQETITIKNNGGSAQITISLSGADKITPTTRDWPDVTVFAQTLKEYGTFPFLITSISKRTGQYTVTFTTPCGSKDLTVIVK